MNRWILLSALFFSVPAFSAATGVNLVYSGNIDGELEPCGCSEMGDQGGIKRHATVLDRLRAEDPNAFVFSGGGLISSFTAGERLTSEYILKGFEALGYDSIGVQWTDLAYGHDYLRSANLPWVSSNFTAGEIAKTRRTIKRGATQFEVFSWLDPASSPEAAMGVKSEYLNSDPKSLLSDLGAAKQRGALTVLTTTYSLARAKEVFALDDVDVLFVASSYEVYGEPQLMDHTLVLQPGSRGMRLGQVRFKLDKENRIVSFESTVHPMPPAVADAPRMLAWYNEYNAKVKEAYELSVKSRKIVDEGLADFVGEAVCATCHVSQSEVWQQTKHAGAYDVLMDVNKSFDPACIKCHTVGFEREGGFIDNLLTKHLTHVQCENCHGAGREHVNAHGKKPMENAGWQPEKMCAQCHIQKHSPEFNFNDYWPKIAH